jgi:aminopeptidase N
MRDFAFILSEELELTNRAVDGVVVNSYFRPEHAAGGRLALDTAVSALTAFSEMFGPYPYTELDVVATPNLLGGMEYPGLVVVEEGLYARMGGVEWLTAHEVAHQWWFAIVGSDQINNPWLDEALTQYSTMLYYEHAYGIDRGAAIVRSVFIDTYEYLVETGRDLPAGMPAAAYSSGQYFQVVYDKGALYFHELRQAIGDELFFEVLQTYYARHRYRIATPASFLAVVQDVTGDRHEAIYEQWIGPLEQ